MGDIPFQRILITGGAGFVGSNLAIMLKEAFSNIDVIAFDNLVRRGSEFNLPRLRDADITYFHGDIRCREDFDKLPKFDLMIDCSAEPSVQAGLDGAPDYLIQTNLSGTLNCLELARKNNAAFIFLSTSRVYPIEAINKVPFSEDDTRFRWTENIPGCSPKGINENFPLSGARSLYGASKLAGELMLQEYVYTYKMPAIINRCGVLTGPWQMGKVDQGVITLWVARHFFNKGLKYIGFGGEGKQVRDILHVRDLFELLVLQMQNPSKWNGSVFNVGGSEEISVSLQELTTICQEVCNNKVSIEKVTDTSSVDLRIFLTDTQLVSKTFNWKPKHSPVSIVEDIHSWISKNKDTLKMVF